MEDFHDLEKRLKLALRRRGAKGSLTNDGQMWLYSQNGVSARRPAMVDAVNAVLRELSSGPNDGPTASRHPRGRNKPGFMS